MLNILYRSLCIGNAAAIYSDLSCPIILIYTPFYKLMMLCCSSSLRPSEDKMAPTTTIETITVTRPLKVCCLVMLCYCYANLTLKTMSLKRAQIRLTDWLMCCRVEGLDRWTRTLGKRLKWGFFHLALWQM